MPAINPDAAVQADAESAAAFFSAICAPSADGALVAGGKWDGVCTACKVRGLGVRGAVPCCAAACIACAASARPSAGSQRASLPPSSSLQQGDGCGACINCPSPVPASPQHT